MNDTESNRRPFYLSIDLEDFTFDMHRSIGNEPVPNPEALWSSYELISDYLKTHLQDKRLTFFTTGTVARTVSNTRRLARP